MSLQPAKLRAIDFAADELGSRSFADLGGVWAVDGGYAFHAARKPHVERVVLVDDNMTAAVHEEAARLPGVELVEANFGRPETAQRVGAVDTVLLFDVLLHQVDPDWDAVLALYAPHVQHVAVVQPQYNGDGEALRLLDLGEQEYLATVPSDGPVYDGLFGRLDEINPQRGRPWRDVHDIWQWGISDAALEARLAELGFTVVHREDGGRWFGFERFHVGAFVATRHG